MILKPNLRRIVRESYYASLDILDWLQGRRDPLIPRRGQNFVGLGDYKEIGDYFLERFVADGGLRPQHRVLDIGCGIGRSHAHSPLI